ncbi:MAG: hypothetical protein JWN10_2158, partial [Solirubrobacterales bacterium]|nr:hypothetical protein [Solirubrobacterales bacterium]
RQRTEYSSHYADEGATGEGSARIQHQFKVDPNKVRALPPGQAFAISRGRAMKIQVLRTPCLAGALPAPTLSHRDQPVLPDSYRSEEVDKLPF